MCVTGAQEGQRKTAHALGMELQKVVGYHMVLGLIPDPLQEQKVLVTT